MSVFFCILTKILKLKYRGLLFTAIIIAFVVLYCLMYLETGYSIDFEGLGFSNLDNQSCSFTPVWKNDTWIGVKDGHLIFCPSNDLSLFHIPLRDKVLMVNENTLECIGNRSELPFYDLFADSNKNIRVFETSKSKYFLGNSYNKYHYGPDIDLYKYSADGLWQKKENFGYTLLNIYVSENYIIMLTPDAILMLDKQDNIHKVCTIKDAFDYLSIVITDKYIFYSVDAFDLQNNMYLKEQSGVFRIDCSDYSVTKVNDNYFMLYNLGDGYLYGADRDSSIYKLDYEGNIVQVIFKVRRKWLIETKSDRNYLWF